jgi:anti-sigma regulatory factor (Ser/Thr protein kinase)
MQVVGEQFGETLPQQVGAPGMARGLLKTWAGSALEPHQLNTARLLVSELVTNAVLHGQGEITLSVWLRADALRVEVRDQGDAFSHDGRGPERPTAGGWGLELVSAESSRWGVGSERARVWFELDLDGLPATSNGSGT